MMEYWNFRILAEAKEFRSSLAFQTDDLNTWSKFLISRFHHTIIPSFHS